MRYFLFFALISFQVYGKQTICLNMIVKDEEHVIRRCLDSVKELIDYWVIVDTGSSDKTKQVILDHMSDIPGELHEIAWKNWGETRSDAFNAARGKGDYILFMDADDILEFEPDFEIPLMTQDLYHFWRGRKGFSYLKPQLVRGDLPWKWVGVTHEYLTCEVPYTSQTLEKLHYTSIDDGARSHDPQKFWKNIWLLEEGLKREPQNSRYVFYLAESYRDAGEKGKALEAYQKRVSMGGWAEEVFWAKLQIGHLLRRIGMPASLVIQAYKDAHEYRPHRFEPLYYLAELYNNKELYQKAYDCIKIREYIARPAEKDILFTEDWIEDYGFLFQLSICSYYVGHYKEAIETCDQLLMKETLPSGWRDMTEMNRIYPILKLPFEAKDDEYLR